MDLKSRILICEQDATLVQEIKESLQSHNYNAEVISDATQLISRTQRMKPAVVVVNADMPGFNDHDICKHIINDLKIPVILILEKNSAKPVHIDDCRPEDVFTKPFKIEDLTNLISKQVTLSNN
ncbi:MAG: response regulator [Bacteroidota bacterium]|nr:response regulator [Bacteroidota bacterium]